MNRIALSRLEDLLASIPSKLIEITEDEYTLKTNPPQWSKKETVQCFKELLRPYTNNGIAYYNFVLQSPTKLTCSKHPII